MRSLAIWLFAVIAASSTAFAQPAPQLTKDQAHFLVTEVQRLITQHYVFPEKRRQIADAIKQADAAGHYNTTDPLEISERLTADLRAVANDGHLVVTFNPEFYADLQKPGRHEDTSLARRTELRHNHGYEEQRMLPGNVRYVRISGFIYSKDRTPAVIDSAARFLADGDAIIIDLRGNGGGDADAVERLISYFFPKGSTQELMTFYDGVENSTTVNRVVTGLADVSFRGKPFYLLTDGGSASAAEEFTYHTQQFRLGTIVGAKTAGGANNNTFFPVAPGFAVSISIGRPIHPVSHTNWEQVGIAPDIVMEPRLALEQAQVMALTTLLAKASGSERASFAWALEGLQAKLKPVRLSLGDMQAYVGTYGIRRVFIEDGILKYQREQLPPATLTPMGNDIFALSNTDDIRIRFRRDGGRIIGFDQVFEGGRPPMAVDRTG